jgi:PAS domain S-box-containing protein
MEDLKAYVYYLLTKQPEAVSGKMLTLLQEAGVIQKPENKGLTEKEFLQLSKTYLSELYDRFEGPGGQPQTQEVITRFRNAVFAYSPDKKNPTSRSLIIYHAILKKAALHVLSDYTRELSVALRISDQMEELILNNLLAGCDQISSEEKNKEKELEGLNAFLSAILENIPNMIFVKDAAELRFVKFNPAGEELLGYSREELIGKNDYDFFPEKQADFFTAKDRAVLLSGKLLDIAEEPIQTLRLGERWLHTKKIPIPAQNGHPGYLLGISEDITDKKKQEDSIRELNQELEAFSYSVSHDLRAPLRAVNGYVQILEEDHAGSLNEEVMRLIRIIKYNAGKMETLINDLLSFSRLGRKELLRSDIDMNELVEGVLREINRAEPNHKAQIKIGTLLPVKADYGLIHQVMFNLISNAVKYSSKKEHPEIEITSRKEGSDILFDVKDNGAGFNMKYVGKLFGVFQRLHRSEEFDGTGVGLAIVKRIVNRHGGGVAAVGEIEHGATFSFSLPIVK